MERMHQEIDKRRARDEGGESERSILAKSACLPRQADQCEDGNRRGGKRQLARTELEKVNQRRTALDHAAELKSERHPVILRIPVDRRRQEQDRDRRACIRPSAMEPGPTGRREHKPQSDRGGEKETGVFREQRKAYRQPHRKPPAPVARSLQLGHGEKQETGGSENERIRRGARRLRGDHQGRVEQQAGGPGRLPVVEGEVRGSPKCPACPDGGEQRNQPYADLRVARNYGAKTYGERDERWMIVIAEREMLGPQPEIGLVEGQRQDQRQNRTKPDKDSDGPEQARAGEPHRPRAG